MRLILIFVITLSCFGQSQALKQYVGLTDPQAAAIVKLNSTYQSNVSAKQQRVNTLNQELAALYANPAPDPNQLGIRYVELESIRRDLAMQLSVLQTQVAAQLTPAQAMAIQNLNTAAEVQPLIADAQCGFLLDSAPLQWFNTTQFVTPPYSAGLFAVAPMPAVPSGNFCGSQVFPASVREYLNLTDAQVSALFKTSAAYNDYYARKQNRIADLYVEIRDETAKPSPSAGSLGVRYAELATIGQDIQNQGNQLRQSARALLTPPQAALLKTLQGNVALQSLIYEADSLNLLVPAPGTANNPVFYTVNDPLLPFPGNIIPSSRVVTLAQFLNLTDVQVSAIHKLNSDYLAYVNAQQSRINTLNNELAGLSANPSPDPNQLGVRYVELEAIRRDMATHLSTLQAQNATQLSKTQMSAIQNLNAAAVLQPLLSDAQCGFLVDPSPFVGIGLADFLLGAVPTAITRSGDFSTLSPGFPSIYPYIPPAPTANFCGSTVYPISVREYLNLTDAEITLIFNQSAAYNDYYARKQNRISDVDVELRDETAKPSPSPLALGLRYSEIAGIGQEITAAGTQLRQAARATLSPQQTTQLKVLQDDVNLQPLISQAQGCNLLVLAPGTASTNGVSYGTFTLSNFVTVTGNSLSAVFVGIFCTL